MKKASLSFLLITLLVITKAQIPNGYYNTADGKTGATLKTALYNIIKGHTEVSYTPGVWNAFYTTDKKTNGKVWDMYSDVPGGTPPYEFTFGTPDQCGSGGSNVENDCYNREHSWPRSWFGGEVPPMNTDLFHIVPTDKFVNAQRSNYPFGEVGVASWTSLNGSKLGTSDFQGYSGTVFEPRDEYKGDFARNYFYMATRYENIVSSWYSNDINAEAILQPNSYPVFETWFINLLYKWDAADPVSNKEIDRNNAVYAIQKNRNPFIDHPEYVNSVWGTNVGIAERPAQEALQAFPNPASEACTITLPPGFNQQNNIFTVYSSTGIPVFAPVTVTGNKASLDLKKVPSGFYLIRLTTGNNSTIYQARIIKK
jgi:endonuclease I